MKKIFLICVSAGFVSNGFAQSSVAEVPENKIKPAYETVPAAKSLTTSAAQKVVTPQPVLNSVGLNAHAQPNLKSAPVATKPAEATKKADNSGSVSDDMQEPVIKMQEQPKVDKAIEPAKQVKETLPAVLKGSSMDPDAKPVMPAVKTPDVTVPAQNSGNTQPAVEQKQVSKENNSVPSSTVPVKKD